MAESEKENQTPLEDFEKLFKFYQGIQDNAAHAIISTTTDGTITSFNKKAEEILGYSAEELVEKETPAIFHDLDEVVKRSKEFSKKLGEIIEPGFKTFVCHTDIGLRNEFEWTYVHKNGTPFPVLLSITAIKNDESQTIGYLGIAQDLTEQKKLENELKERNQKLEQAQSMAKIGSWSFHIESGTIFWSKEMFNIFPEKIEEGEPSFDKHRSSIHKDDVELWERTVGKCLENGRPYKMLFRTHKLEDKSKVVWVEARGEGIIKNGKIESLSGTCQDVTERVEKEIELKEQSEALRRAEMAKSQFLANMSHEIRTPLNGMIGMLNLLRDSKLNEEQDEMLDLILESSETLLILLSDILDISKIDSGKMDLEKVNFDLNKILENLAVLIAPKAKTNSTKIELKLPVESSLFVIGDQVKIKQILLNFLSNAVKFTKDGNIVIGYNLKDENDDSLNLEFFVKDNGIGIDEENQKNIFNAFEQADNSITRKFGGTGLGLAICSKLAALMGGRVYAESQKSKGSTFFFSVSLKKGTKENRESVNSLNFDQSLSEKFPHRILLVEDNEINQKVAIMTLRKFGYECELAKDGIEAIKMINKSSIGYYSIILMDLQMPVMDGITATKEIIKKYGKTAPPIIALTANAFSSDKQKCLDAGMSGHLSKPLETESLIEVLKSCSK